MQTSERPVAASAKDGIEWPSFFMGGFESSTHRRRDGRRLDLVESTQHRRFADADYERLRLLGLRGSREGIAWHLIERDGTHDFGSVLPIVRAADRTGVRVTWDLMHFGWPDGLDIFAPVFLDRFVALAVAFVDFLARESTVTPRVTPINEMSFLSWAGGDVAAFNPFATGRGFELKCQLVRAALAAIDAMRRRCPRLEVVVHEPAFHVAPPRSPTLDPFATEHIRATQFQATDMMLGRTWPQLGGHEDAVDVIGVNYYPWNQWTFETAVEPRMPIVLGDARYRPLADILCEWHGRYGKPVYLGETGCEGDARAPWLRYASDAIHLARARGADVRGLCLYPVVNFPGWDDDRHCLNGLWDYADATGSRRADPSLVDELRFQQQRNRFPRPPC